MKCYSNPIMEHDEVPVPDDNKLKEYISDWEHRESRHQEKRPDHHACYVISFQEGSECSNKLAEILSLVKSQGDRILGQEVISIGKPNPRTVLGSGKIKEIASRALVLGSDQLVLDAELSPSQLRNVEDVAGMDVCDRESVILNVFLRHARTRKSKIQIEIAQLEYLRPRIRGLGLDMDQQASSLVTGRGPGETASAMLARKLDHRLSELKKALAKISKTGSLQRRGRSGSSQVTLVGYTNAGKTSLMNALTGEDLSAKNRPFETLDTTTRRLSGHGGDVLLSDTVGFIRNLPERLFDSFESTLDIIKDAALLLVVVDVSDGEKALHVETTMNVLDRLDAGGIPMMFVFNKSDCLDRKPPYDELKRICKGRPWVCLSSGDQKAVSNLKASILAKVRTGQSVSDIHVPYDAKDVFSMIYARCRVLQSEAGQSGMRMVFEGPQGTVSKIESMVGEENHG